MTEAPPIGSIVVVVNWPAYNGLQYTVESTKDGYAYGNTTEGLPSAGVPQGHGCNFQFKFIEIVETKSLKKLGEAIIVFKEGIDGDKVGNVDPLNGVKFLRKYLNGRNLEYIYEVSKIADMQKIMTHSSIKTFLWVPGE